MSILDTFYILFKSDSSDLKKGAEEVKNTVETLKSFLLSAIPTGFISAGVKHIIDFNVELVKTSRMLGVNVEQLNAWRNAVELAGGSGDAFEGTLTSLSERLGISSQTALNILPRYADALSKLNPATAQRVGKMLGLDEGTILLLQKGRREVGYLIDKQKQLGTITQQDAEQYLKYNEATIKVKQSTQALFSIIAIEALPHLIKFFDYLQRGITYFTNHKDFVIGGFYAISAAVTALGIRFAIASLPMYLMSALILGLIGLFALVYDDIANFLKGNRSVVGFLLDKYPLVGATIKEVFENISQIVKVLSGDLDLLYTKFQKVYQFLTGTSAKNPIFDTSKFNIQGSDQTVTTLLKSQVALANAERTLEAAKTTNVSVGDVTINTQATDVGGIANAFANKLNQELAQVANYHADGVHS